MSAEITVSPKAHDHLMRLRAQSGLDTSYGLRVSVVGGGCSGLSYQLDFDNEEQPGDQVFEAEDIKLYVSLKSYLYLAGTELDYSDGLQGKGFHFQNPNATRNCGCGESFAV
nr:hypothetical protein [uncultured bacterium]